MKKVKMIKKVIAVIFAVSLIAFSGCQFTTQPQIITDISELEVSEGFNFSTVRMVSIDLDFSPYGPMPVVLYGADSLNEDSFSNTEETILLKDLEKLATVMVHDSGTYTGSISVPRTYNQLIVSPLQLGLPNNIIVDINDDSAGSGAGFTYNSSRTASLSSRSLSRDPDQSVPPKTDSIYTEYGYSYISSDVNFKPFDNDGLSLNIYPITPEVTVDMLENISAALPEYRDNSVNVKDSILKFTDDAEVTVTFIHEGAGYLNTLGFFVSNDPSGLPDKAPDIEDIRIIFPNASMLYSGGSMKTGDTVHLGTFSEGQEIVWNLLAKGWSGNSNRNDFDEKPSYFSYRSWNPEGEAYNQHAVVLLDKTYEDGSATFIVGMEDLERPKGDNDFNDLVFMVQVTPEDAVENIESFETLEEAKDSDSDGIADVFDVYPDNPHLSSVTGYTGTIAFEDNWPMKGDYDFNDFVAGYRYTIRTDARNYIRSLTAEIEVLALGGGFKNGLYLKLPAAYDSLLLDKSDYDELRINDGERPDVQALPSETIPVESVDDGTALVVKLIENANRDVFGTPTTIINTIPKGMKIGGIIGDDSRIKKPDSISGTLYFKEGTLTLEDLGEAPFDLFLIREGDEKYEIHLPDLPPSGLIDQPYLGKYDDDSVVGIGRYYKTSSNLPWALHVPSNWDYPVEKGQIIKAYPNFADWALSEGKKYPDWYLNEEGNRNTKYIYAELIK